MEQVTLNLPEEIVHLLGLKEKDLEREFLIRFAVTLYAEGRISLGKAAEISGLAYADIMELLAEFGLGIKYGNDDLEDDLRALREIE